VDQRDRYCRYCRLALPMRDLPNNLPFDYVSPRNAERLRHAGSPKALQGHIRLFEKPYTREVVEKVLELYRPDHQFNRLSVESNQDTILVSFVGYDSHPVRRQLAQLHNGRDIVVLNSADRPHLGRATTQSSLHQDEVRPFASILGRSRFGFVPRGDAPGASRRCKLLAPPASSGNLGTCKNKP
jgi:hypothetical protein